MSQLCVHARPDRSATDARSRATATAADAQATRLMDRYRKTGSPAIFERLFRLTSGSLLRRVRQLVRFCGDRLDPQEVLQDAFVNIFRYPDRFDASRPGAFRAWATTIVENTVRRHLRRSRTGLDIALRPSEILAQEPDLHARSPELDAMDGEARSSLSGAYVLVLATYMAAFRQLNERERFALHAVEVLGLRYGELGHRLGLRAEAVKMVVFRARRRIAERMARQLML